MFLFFSQITLITTINNCMKASDFVFCFWVFFHFGMYRLLLNYQNCFYYEKISNPSSKHAFHSNKSNWISNDACTRTGLIDSKRLLLIAFRNFLKWDFFSKMDTCDSCKSVPIATFFLTNKVHMYWAQSSTI